MSVGDGVIWNEALPDNDTVANEIDDYTRHLMVGVRSRMALEHMWPSSQTGTGQAGHHNFITFQAQTAAPTLATASGQVGGLFVRSSGGLPLVFEASDGTEVVLVNSSKTLPIVSAGTQGSIPICSSASPTTLVVLAASAKGMTLHTNTGTAAPTWSAINLSDTAETSGILVGTRGGTGFPVINIGSITFGDGAYTITFANAFSDTTYAVTFGWFSSAAGYLPAVTAKTVNNCTVTGASMGGASAGSLYYIAIGS